MSSPIQRSEQRHPSPEPSGQDERSPRLTPPGLPWFPGSGRRTRPSPPGRSLPRTAVGTLRPLRFRPGAPPARQLPPTAHLDLLRPPPRELAFRLATVRYAPRSSAARPRSGLSFLPSHDPFRGPPKMPTADCYSQSLPPYQLSACLLTALVCSHWSSSRVLSTSTNRSRDGACPRSTRRGSAPRGCNS